MSEVLVDARRLLVPWLNASAALTHARETVPRSEEEVLALFSRAMEISQPEIVAESVSSAIADDNALRLMNDALQSAAPPLVAAAMAPIIRSLAPVIAAPTDVLDADAEIVEVGEETVSSLIDGESVDLYIHRLPEEFHPVVGVSYRVHAFRDEDGDWVVTTLIDESGDILAQVDAPDTVSAAAKEVATKLLVTLIRSAAPTREIGRVLSLSPAPEPVAQELLLALQARLASLSDPTLPMSRVLSSRGYSRHPTLCPVLLRILFSDSVAMASQTRRAGESAAQWLLQSPADLLPLDVPRLVERRASALRHSGFLSGVQPNRRGRTRKSRARLLAFLVAPVDAVSATESLLKDLRVALDEAFSDAPPENAASDAEAILEALRLIARRRPRTVRARLKGAEYRESHPELAASLLRVYSAANALSSLREEFVAFAVRSSPEAAIDALDLIADQSLASSALGRNVIASAAQHNSSRLLDPLATVIRTMPRLERFGGLSAIAVEGSPQLSRAVAERAAAGKERTDFHSGLVEHVIRTFPRDLSQTMLAVNAVARDAGARPTNSVLQQHAALATDLFKRAKTPAALSTALVATHELLPSGRRVPGLQGVREIGIAAVERIARRVVDRDEADAILDALDALGWRVRATARRLDRLSTQLRAD